MKYLIILCLFLSGCAKSAKESESTYFTQWAMTKSNATEDSFTVDLSSCQNSNGTALFTSDNTECTCSCAYTAASGNINASFNITSCSANGGSCAMFQDGQTADLSSGLMTWESSSNIERTFSTMSGMESAKYNRFHSGW
jgi:hypothetical protein